MLYFFFLCPGLVHRTHMSSCRVDKPSEIVDVGDKVWVKLIGREVKFCANFIWLERIRKSQDFLDILMWCVYVINCGWEFYFESCPIICPEYKPSGSPLKLRRNDVNYNKCSTKDVEFTVTFPNTWHHATWGKWESSGGPCYSSLDMWVLGHPFISNFIIFIFNLCR